MQASSDHSIHRSVWEVPAYLPYLQPDLSDAAVAAVEIRLNVKLPESYLAILREQNGGSLRWSYPELPNRDIWGIGPHFPHIGEYQYWQDEANYPDIWRPTDPRRLVPFDGDGHWHLCLDYRRDGEPSVSYIDLEAMEDRLIAPDFAAFLAALKPDNDELIGLIGIFGDTDLDDCRVRLDKLLNTSAQEGQGTDDLGYPTYFWPHIGGISPNSVPRGFVRARDPRYAELKDRLPGEALRYPEFPDVKVLLKVISDSAADKLVSAGGAAGINMRKLSL